MRRLFALLLLCLLPAQALAAGTVVYSGGTGTAQSPFNLVISNTAPSLILTDTTASAKSLTIAVDANLAQFRESAGASGSLLVLDLANNYVGIGTTGPDRKLDVLDVSNPQLRLTHTDGSVYTELQTTSAGYLSIKASGDRVLVGTAGSGGIETPFGVRAPNQSNITMTLYDSTAMAQDVGGAIAFGGQDGVNDNRWFASMSGGKENGTSGNYAGYLVYFTRQNGSSLAERMRITSSGNVGIGTTSPLLKLDVAGSGRFTGMATSVLTGSIDAIASTTVTGVGTLFTTELVVGDRITITGETRTVYAIASDTSLTVDSATTDTANDTSVDKLHAIFITRLSSGAFGFGVNDLGYIGIGRPATASPIDVWVSGSQQFVVGPSGVVAARGGYFDAIQTNNYSLTSVGLSLGGTTGSVFFTNSSAYSGTKDAGISRGGAGIVAIGTGTIGNKQGTLYAYAVGASGANGQSYLTGYKTELTTIAAAATTTTTITIPANAILKAVMMRVTVAPPGTATAVVTATTSGTVLQTGASMATTINTTDTGIRAWGTNYNGVAAQTITITPNATPSDATGRVRFDIYYEEPTVATS